jgi:hypothetical protein
MHNAVTDRFDGVKFKGMPEMVAGVRERLCHIVDDPEGLFLSSVFEYGASGFTDAFDGGFGAAWEAFKLKA